MIDPLSTGGGRIWLRADAYPVDTRIDIVSREGITIEGTTASVVTVSVGSTLLIDGTSSDLRLRGITLADCTGKGVNIKLGTDIRIIDCSFRNLAEPAIQGHVFEDTSNPLTNLMIRGCRVTSCDLSNTDGGRGAVYIDYAENLLFTNNIVGGSGSTGVSIHRSSRHVTVADNMIRGNDVNAAE